MVSLLRKRRPMVLASGSSLSFPLADLAVPRKLLPQRSFWLRMRVVMYSAMTWLSTVEPPLSKGLTKVIGCGRAIHREHETRPGPAGPDETRHGPGRDEEQEGEKGQEGQNEKDDMKNDSMKQN